MELSPERAIAADPALSLLQKTLLITDGTVTQLLEVFTGEKIRVEKLEHELVQGGPPELGVDAGEPVLSRGETLKALKALYILFFLIKLKTLEAI